jgi:hypothetical protein
LAFSEFDKVKSRKHKKPEYAKLNKCALDPWFNGAEPAKVHIGQCLGGLPDFAVSEMCFMGGWQKKQTSTPNKQTSTNVLTDTACGAL